MQSALCVVVVGCWLAGATLAGIPLHRWVRGQVELACPHKPAFPKPDRSDPESPSDADRNPPGDDDRAPNDSAPPPPTQQPRHVA